MKALKIDQLEKIVGGVTRAEYCNTLAMIITNNTITDSMLSAWGTHCAPYGVKYYE